MDTDYQFLVREMPSFFSQIYHGVSFIEETFKKFNVDYLKKDFIMQIKDKKIICKEIYVKKESFESNIPSDQKAHLIFIINGMTINQINDMVLYQSDILKSKKNLVKRIGKLEKLIYATQKEIDYRGNKLTASKQFFEAKMEKYGKDIMAYDEANDLWNGFRTRLKSLFFLSYIGIHNIQVYITTQLIKELEEYVREGDSLRKRLRTENKSE
jgi:hypothetical protein